MITYLRWRDATYYERQYLVRDMPARLQLSETVGTFVRETDEFISVALDCFPIEYPGEEVEYRHIANVPKSCIERRVDFEVPDEKGSAVADLKSLHLSRSVLEAMQGVDAYHVLTGLMEHLRREGIEPERPMQCVFDYETLSFVFTQSPADLNQPRCGGADG